MKAFTGKDFGK